MAIPPGPLPAPDPPEILGIDPPGGPAAGGYPVTIEGRNFGGASRVTFGGAECEVFHLTLDGKVVAFVPEIAVATAQLVEVYVTARGGNSDPWPFRAIPAPRIHSILPVRSDDPDTEITISGAHLGEATAVYFETVPPPTDPARAATAPAVSRVPSASLAHGNPPDAVLMARRPRGPSGPTKISVVTPGGTSNSYEITLSPDVSQRLIFMLQLIYMLALIVGLVLYNNWGDFRDRLPNPLGPIPLGVPWFGAFGAVALSISGLVDHRNDWDRAYIYWHISRPVIGVAFAVGAYFTFAAGVLASNGTLQNAQNAQNAPSSPSSTNNLFYYILAFIVGFREETFRTLIKRVSDIIIGPGTTTPAAPGTTPGTTATPATPTPTPAPEPAPPAAPAPPAPIARSE
jgi:hypothetical protein